MRNRLALILITAFYLLQLCTAGAAPQQATVGYLIAQSKKKMQSGDYMAARDYMNQAEKKAIQSKNADTLLACYGDFAVMLYQQQRYAEALEIGKKQLALSQKAENQKQASNAYNNIAVQYRNMGNLKSAAHNLLLGLAIAEQQRDSVNLKKFYNNLSSVFIDLNDKRNSLLYARKSYQFAILLRDTLQIARSLSNLAISEVLNAELDQAKAHLLTQTAIAKKIEAHSILLDAYINLSDIYNRNDQPEKALDLYKKALQIQDQSVVDAGKMYIYYGMANSYAKSGHFHLAEQYIKTSLLSAAIDMPKNDLKEVYKLASEISEKNKDAKSALHYWKKYNLLDDSILNATTQQSIQEMDIKYKSSIKEKKLAQQQLQITSKNYELERKNRYIFIAIMVIILLICASSITYLIYKGKSQTIQLTLLKAQIHPHFLFNTLNNLYSLSLNKSDHASGVVLGLSQILRYILYECNSPKINLGKEIEIIERYISLERIRYQSRLEINLDLRGDLANHQIAPLLILPLVENAFKHGISKIEEDGWIKMETNIKHGELTFKISNNTPAVSAEVSKSKYGNIGLNNIRKRLQMLYPNTHDFRIINEDDIFLVIMKLKLGN